MLDLASSEPVRRRFGLSDDDLDQLALWVDGAAIRWGLDVRHRGSYGLTHAENTWRAGLDRVLLGVAMAAEDHRFVGATLPVDDVASNDIDLAGRFGEYVDRLGRFVEAAEAATTMGDWVAALSTGVAQIAQVAPREIWQQAQFDRELARIGDSATGAGAGTTRTMMLADVRHLLAHRLGGRPTRANFRTGTLTVCTMVPMRSVPHRVVCLLGLDDGVFPRAGSVDGDDVLARAPMTGERDVRSEDRQLFLDAILAARGDAGRHLHRRQRADRCPETARRAARRAAGRAGDDGGLGGREAGRGRARPPRAPSATTSWCTTRCSRSTSATSCRGS